MLRCFTRPALASRRFMVVIGLGLGVIGPGSWAFSPAADPVPQGDKPTAAGDKPAAARYEMRDDFDPDGINKFYFGRQIAHVMGWQGASWLERPERDREEDPKALLRALDLKPGQTVADVGAGSGYHVFRMAPLVGPQGKVLAVDIQPQMLRLMRNTAQKKNITNVEFIQSTETDAKLPAQGVDLILLVDVYHELAFPYEMTENLVQALKPAGRLVLVEFRAEDPQVPIKAVHKMSERQVLKELEIFPQLRHSRTISTLPWQHILIFEKQRPAPGQQP